MMRVGPKYQSARSRIGKKGVPCFPLAVLAVAVLALVPAAPPVWAQGAGDLLITPTRIVMSGRTRSAEVTLFHRGSATATYRIRFQNMRMTDEGGLERVEEGSPDDMFADKFLRYSPRQVVLEAGASQIIRILARKPSGLAPGEYRSHLLFQAVPDESVGADIEALTLEEGEISVRLIPIYGISIPVIVRHGDLSATLSISDPVLEPPENEGGSPVVSFRLNRGGDRSVYGDIVVTFMPNGGEPREVGLIRGIAVYTPNESRPVRMALRIPEDVTLEDGRLNVAFSESPETNMAEVEIIVP